MPVIEKKVEKQHSVVSPVAACMQYKGDVSRESTLSMGEKRWFTSMLDLQIECFDTLDKIHERRSSASSAEQKLQTLYVDMLKKLAVLNECIVNKMRSKDDAALNAFQQAVVAFGAQKQISDKVISSFISSFGDYSDLANHLESLEALIDDDTYSNNRNVIAFHKNSNRPALVRKISEDVIKIRELYEANLGSYNAIKQRVEEDTFAKGLKSAIEKMQLYKKLPPYTEATPVQSNTKSHQQTQAQTVSKVGVLKAPSNAPATQTPQTARRVEMVR